MLIAADFVERNPGTRMIPDRKSRPPGRGGDPEGDTSVDIVPASKGLYVFDKFPHAWALGQARLQQLCDAFAETTEARGLGVTTLTVGDETDGMPLMPRFGVGAAVEPGKGDQLYRILAGLYEYIVQNAVPAEHQEVARRFADRLPKPAPPVSQWKAGAAVKAAFATQKAMAARPGLAFEPRTGNAGR
jgi:hypothetical protein